MKLTVVLLLLSTALSCHALLEAEWEEWKMEHGKVYHSALEEASARAVWQRHTDFIQSHNSRVDVTFTLAMNQFGDQVLRSEPRPQRSQSLSYVPEVTNNFLPRAPPKSFDWRTRGVITPVKNQGSLGESDAYVVTEELESLHAIKTGQLVELSVQEVVDCCSLVRGMVVPDIFECIARHGGLCSGESYPAGGSGECRNDSCQAAANDAKVTVHIHRGDESQMVTAVLQRPLVVYIDASKATFQFYKSGVYSDPDCSQGQPDHAMQLVGYGVDRAGTPYWILKNSWGRDWGMEGYVQLRKGVNMCGVANFAYYPM